MLSTRRARVLLFLALATSALLVYVPRTYRAVTVMGDSAELVTAAANGGVPHPPGYPLYIAIAHAMTRVPLAELPFRVHVTSAIFHALTVAVVGSIIAMVTESLAAALLGAVTLALGRIFLLGSLYAEVFPLNDLFFALLLWIAIHDALRSRDPPAAGTSWRLRSPPELLAATLLGFALAHHHMIVLALPALIVLIGPNVRRSWRMAIGAALCAVVPPLALYALIPLAAARQPVPSWGDVHDLASLFRLVIRQDYGGLTHASRRLVDGQLLERIDALFTGAGDSFGIVGVLLFFMGIRWGLFRARRMGAALLTALFCTGPLFAALNAIDIHSDYRVAFFERFTTMCHVPIAILVGFGTAQIEAWFAASPRISPHLARAGTALIAALAVTPLFANLWRFDFRTNRRGAEYVHDLIDSAPDGALVLLKSDMASQAAQYACGVEQRCGARIVLTPGQLWMPWKRNELSRRYPGLLLPPPDLPSPARWLAEHNLARRPVLVHPELVEDVARQDFSVLPSLLLFRVYADEDTLRADLPRFRAELDDVAQGRRREGISIVKTEASSHGVDAHLKHIYEEALQAYATAASQLGWKEEARSLTWSMEHPSRD